MLSFTDDGRGPGTPALLLHGFGLDGRSWAPQTPAFSASRRVVTVDLPGFGPRGRDASGGHGPAAEVLEVLDALGIERAHVLGHSFGAAVAVDLTLARPDRVASLVVVGGVLLGRPSRLASWPACIASAKSGDLDAARRAWLADPLFVPARERPAVALALEQMVMDYGCAQWMGRVRHEWFFDDPAPRLAEVRVPSLVVDAERELDAFKEMAAEYAARLPRARRVTLARAGHCPGMEEPDAFNEAVAAFMEDADRSP